MRVFSLASLSLVAVSGINAQPTIDIRVQAGTPKNEAGAVFALNNDPADDKVVAFSRNADGALTQVKTYSTGGRGQGVDFDTQGGLQLNADHSYLYAVSPASDHITVFSVQGSTLKKVQTIYGGDQPLSFTLSKSGYAYSLTGSVASTGIFGFKVDEKSGMLSPLTNKTIPLSTPIGVPGVVAFAPDGRSLIVTNKVGSTIDVFSVDKEGQASAAPVNTVGSSGLRPFGAVFNNQSSLYVVESGLPAISNSGVSTYHLNKGDVPSLSAVTKSEKNEQTDACWIVVTPDQRYVYTSNFVSGSISSYSTFTNGTTSLLKGDAALPGDGSEPVDLALSSDGKYLYNLLRGSGAVIGWKINEDGSLKQIGELFGKDKDLPAGFGVSGLAAF
ncbi:lactonase 7-bladed beta-propeller domain-containing [Fusarium albosuccineum]|uniref:Lactonase 7-bladed beta-propeller domain-containing n=1 Tax=Fusarium albosuccineum TaxID=1237068 RepID=A0A8H4K9D4_9HYPO|nr:lactonase 7-bladed beta-propeller domain-containing [Fusarium albosuccineum]